MARHGRRPGPGRGDPPQACRRVRRAGLSLLEACGLPDDPAEAATVTLPAWWLEVIAAFRDLYEPAEAEYRVQKVLEYRVQKVLMNELIGKRMGRDKSPAHH